MKKNKVFLLLSAYFFIISVSGIIHASDESSYVNLPPVSKIEEKLGDLIVKRKTDRNFNPSEGITIQELSNILFYMQGITHGKKRSVASAHGTYPLELYAVVNNVSGLVNGIYRLDIPKFRLKLLKSGDYRNDISRACYGQSVVKNSSLRIIITSVWERLESKTGDESRKWGAFEAGEATQNGFLAAAAMGIKTTPVGGMDPKKVAGVIGVEFEKETPIIVNCFGR